jgi:effector-binding domain-containing protein
MRRHLSGSIVVAWMGMWLAGALAAGAEEPKKAPEGPPECVVGEMRIQRLPGPTYFYTEMETTIPKTRKAVGDIMPVLLKTIGENNVHIAGPSIFVAVGATGDPETPFKLSMGFSVAEGTKPAGDFKVKKLADFRCATVLYSGPPAKVGEAYGKLFASLMAAGHQPTGETREYCLYWESEKSPNNVMLIQAGIKEP